MDYFNIVKIGILTTISFLVALFCTPIMTKYLYKYKMGKQIRDNTAKTPVFSELHAHKKGTLTMGGIIIWGTVFLLSLLFYILPFIFKFEIFEKLNFLTRSQTLLPLGAMVASAAVGLIDDYMNVKRIGPKGGGLSLRYKLLTYFLIACVGAYWFYFKLDWDLIHIPFLGNFSIGLWYIPIFIFIIFATSFSVNEIDGLDGLAGGTLLYSFLAFGAIAFLLGKYDLAAFCGVIVGALFAFLWFNIPPARFFMGDTGAMSLGVTLGIVVMLTNSLFLLPVIGFLFVLEALSVVIQILSKKFRNGKKVFISAPIHHHFEAKGWPESKIVMRAWVIASVLAIIGLIIALIDKSF